MSDRVPTLDTQDRGGFGPDPRNHDDPLLAAVAARDLAVEQREDLRTALAELVDAVDTALNRPDNDPGEALGELDRPHREANRVLLDTPHRNTDANLDQLMIGRWPVKSCGAVAPHPPHVGGPIHTPWQCRGFGGFD